MGVHIDTLTAYQDRFSHVGANFPRDIGNIYLLYTRWMALYDRYNNVDATFIYGRGHKAPRKTVLT